MRMSSPYTQIWLTRIPGVYVSPLCSNWKILRIPDNWAARSAWASTLSQAPCTLINYSWVMKQRHTKINIEPSEPYFALARAENALLFLTSRVTMTSHNLFPRGLKSGENWDFLTLKITILFLLLKFIFFIFRFQYTFSFYFMNMVNIWNIRKCSVVAL